MPERRRPRGVTTRPRWGGSSRECQAATEQERPRGATSRPRTGLWPGGDTQHPRSGVAAGRTYPMPEDRGGGREEEPLFQGAVAVRAQEGLEELFQVQVQKGRW